MVYRILYNGKAGSGHGLDSAKKIESVLQDGTMQYVDVTSIDSYDDYMSSLPEDTRVILTGGDGTLNYYVNHTTEATRDIPLDYFATGTGNDFLRDIGVSQGEIVKDVNRFFKNLPTVTVGGKSYKFLNGVGYGIDGYCCEIGDIQRAKSDKPVNYTGIAIKGILFHFRPVQATVDIDGNRFFVEKTWLVPTMKGRFYGGGMMACPEQDRMAQDRKVSVMTYKTGFPLKALIVFPNIFKGEHIKNKKVVSIYTGNKIRVSFDRPCALQIDGETVLNVSEYEVTT
ncbi:MAG: diacylglycerol kinase family protein [Lachnospiraceae bacterium]|nr:diacylglycerol kinase family protein [Lachnospiraceae bacterium]